MKVYLLRNGQVHGPYSRVSVEGFIDDDQVTVDELACQSGTDRWIPLGELIESDPLSECSEDGLPLSEQSQEDLKEREGNGEEDVEEDLEEEQSDEGFDEEEFEEDPVEKPQSEELHQLDSSEIVDKIKNLIVADEVQFAMDMIDALEDEKIDVCVGLLQGVETDYEGSLSTPDWLGYDSSKMVFLYAALGIAYDDPRIESLRKKLTKISLDYADLNKLPDAISLLKEVEELTLVGNSLKKLPSCMGTMKRLSKVNLSSNGLKKIPAVLADLSGLEELDLSGNNFKKKPEFWDELKLLKGLKALDLSGNALELPPDDLSELDLLERVDLSQTSLKKDRVDQAVRALASLPALTSVSLASCKISRIPEGILELSGLESIDLSGNKLKDIPIILSQLPNLESPVFWGNPFAEVNQEEFHEDFPSFAEESSELPDFDFSGWEEPDPIPQKGPCRELLDDLEEAMEGHDLETIDKAIDAMIEHGQPELLSEAVRGCSLDENGYLFTGPHFPFPKWIPSIFASASVEENPSEIWKGAPWSYGDDRSSAAIPHYVMIRLMACLPQDESVHPSLLIKNVKRLFLVLPQRMPSDIGSFTELEELVVARNDLIFIPSKFGNLSNLRVLELNENKLTELPSSMGQMTNLRHLRLNDNSLDELPDWIGSLKELRILDLAGNRVKELPAGIGDLTNLQFLGLRANKLSALPPEIGNLGSLMHLWLGGNSIKTLPDEIYQLESLLAMGLVDNPCIPTDNKWLRGVNLSHRPDKINLMAMKAENSEDAKWILNNVLSWNGS